MVSHVPKSTQEEPGTGRSKDPLDPSLQKAFDDCCRENTMLPLIKQELKCKLQMKRMAGGLGELSLDFQPTPSKYPLTEEEVWKKNMRKRQNRESANRVRHKGRQYEENLIQKIATLKDSNASLLEIRNSLREERDNMREMLTINIEIHESINIEYNI